MRLPRRPTSRDRRPPRTGPVARSLPDPAELTGIEALGLVISVYGADRLAGRGNKRASDHAIRDAARRLAREARQRDSVRAERLLIALRRAWVQLPAVQRLSDAVTRRALWDRVVLLCCEEFYAPDWEASRATTPRSAAFAGPLGGMSAN